MRKLIAAAFVSLDGVMQAPGGPEEDPAGGFKFGGWTVPYWSKDDGAMGEAMSAMFARQFDLVLGRKTYEIFAAYWPFTDAPPGPEFNKAKKYVATRSGAPLTWENSLAMTDAVAEIAKLKKENGPTLLTQGSGDLIQSLLKADLIDEIRLITFPVILGKGKRFFEDGAKPGALKLVSSKISAAGVTLTNYERAGEVETGSFGADKPSELEKARQEKVKREG